MHKSVLFFLFCLSICSQAIDIVAENVDATCEEYQLVKELRVYKDPSLFLSSFALVNPPGWGPEALDYENPLLTTIKGPVQMMRLGPARPFRHFGAIAKFYQMAAPDKKSKKSFLEKGQPSQVWIIPIKICGRDPYSDTLGFVLASDLSKAQIDDAEEGQLPPSTLGNPIPKLKAGKSG